jgi:hypothetical protein
MHEASSRVCWKVKDRCKEAIYWCRRRGNDEKKDDEGSNRNDVKDSARRNGIYIQNPCSGIAYDIVDRRRSRTAKIKTRRTLIDLLLYHHGGPWLLGKPKLLLCFRLIVDNKPCEKLRATTAKIMEVSEPESRIERGQGNFVFHIIGFSFGRFSSAVGSKERIVTLQQQRQQ